MPIPDDPMNNRGLLPFSVDATPRRGVLQVVRGVMFQRTGVQVGI